MRQVQPVVSNRKGDIVSAVNTPTVYEIDMRLLWRNMWAVRRSVLIAALILTVIYWAVWAVDRLMTVPVYSHVVQFTFDGAVEERYPDGSPFRVSDLIAPSVLSAVYDRNSLAEQGVPKAAFKAGFRVQPYTLDGRNILPTDSDQAAPQVALLSFTPTVATLSVEQIEKILSDVPRLWQERAVGGFVFDSHKALERYHPFARIFKNDLMEWMTYDDEIELLLRQVGRLNRNMDTLEDLTGGRTMSDDDTGYSLAGTRAAVKSIMRIIQRIRIHIDRLGLARNKALAVSLLRQEIETSGRIQKIRRSRLESVREIQHFYADNMNATGSRLQSLAREGDTEAKNSSGAFSAQMTYMGRNDNDILHVEMMMEEELSLIRKIHDVEETIAASRERLDRLIDGDNDEFKSMVEADIAKAVGRLRNVTGMLYRMNAKLDEHLTLYTSDSPGEDIQMSGGPPNMQDILLYLLLLFAVSGGVLTFAMRWRRATNRKNGGQEMRDS